MKKPKQKEPHPALALIAVGIFCLGVGYALSYALEKQTPIGGNIDNADLALAAGIILCGIAWIAAWAKARN